MLKKIGMIDQLRVRYYVILTVIATIVLNATENKDNNISKNLKLPLRQSDKETASQNKSRAKLTKPYNTVKASSGEVPEKYHTSMQNRAFGIRNWNNIHD